MEQAPDSPSERIHRLMTEGTVAREEGERLLAAINDDDDSRKPSSALVAANAKKRSLGATILNPYDRFGGGIAATIGAVVAIASIAVSQLGVHFDGFLDLHVGRTPAIHVAIAEQVAGFLLPAICFWAYAKAVGAKHVRILDFIGMVGFARLTVFIGAFPVLAITPAVHDPTKIQSPAMLALVTIALLFIAINIALLYQGFKNASGLRGAKLIAGFIVGLIVVEMLSKLALIPVS